MVLFEFRKTVCQFLLALHTYYFSISTRLAEILDCSFQWGSITPDFGEGEAIEGQGTHRDGTVRKNVGGFL